MVNYNLDGGSNQDTYTNVNNPFPNPDAVEEFSVQTNSFSAEYGRGSGAIVNVVTKSGTNQFHGTAFDFLRNGDLNARNFFAAGTDQLKRNQFGGSVGGPIIKRQAILLRHLPGNADPATSSTAIPPRCPRPPQRNGDFSSHQPRNWSIRSPGRRFPNNQIPTSDFAPASVKILQSAPGGRYAQRHTSTTICRTTSTKISSWAA